MKKCVNTPETFIQRILHHMRINFLPAIMDYCIKTKIKRFLSIIVRLKSAAITQIIYHCFTVPKTGCYIHLFMKCKEVLA